MLSHAWLGTAEITISHLCYRNMAILNNGCILDYYRAVMASWFRPPNQKELFLVAKIARVLSLVVTDTLISTQLLRFPQLVYIAI